MENLLRRLRRDAAWIELDHREVDRRDREQVVGTVEAEGRNDHDRIRGRTPGVDHHPGAAVLVLEVRSASAHDRCLPGDTNGALEPVRRAGELGACTGTGK